VDEFDFFLWEMRLFNIAPAEFPYIKAVAFWVFEIELGKIAND
jgi:hypothetical protein